MSIERSFEVWEEVQRHGLDLVGRLTQGFTGLIQSHIIRPSFSWPNPQTTKLFDVEFPAQNFLKKNFGLAIHRNSSGINDGVSAIFDIGNKLGQAGADFGAGLNGMVQQIFRRLPMPFRHEEVSMSLTADMNGQQPDVRVSRQQVQEELESLTKRFNYGVVEKEKVADGSVEEKSSGFNLKTAGCFGEVPLIDS